MIECNQCGWQGYDSELQSKTGDFEDKDYKYCPQCGAYNDFDYEEDEEDE